PKVANDVFDNHDGVVDQNADGENQREEGSTIQRVAVQKEDGQSQRQGDGDRQQNDPRLPPSQSQRDKQGDRQGGDKQVLQKLIRLVLCGFTVIARDRDIQVVGQHVAAKGVDLLLHAFGNERGVGPPALRQSERHG